MIYDLRSMISCGCASRIENLDQLDGFGLKAFHTFGADEFRALGDLNPQVGLVCLFQHDRDFVDEIRARFSAQRGPIIGSDRTTAASDLIRDSLSGRFVRQRVSEFQNSDGELNGSFLEFSWVHEPESAAPEKIINQKS
jgi:hypothetical protein